MDTPSLLSPDELDDLKTKFSAGLVLSSEDISRLISTIEWYRGKSCSTDPDVSDTLFGSTDIEEIVKI